MRLHYCMCVRCSVHGSQLVLDVRYECCYKILAKIARAISKQQNVPTNIHTVYDEDDAYTHKRSNNQFKQFQAVNFRLHWLRYCEGREYSEYYTVFSTSKKLGKN